MHEDILSNLKERTFGKIPANIIGSEKNPLFEGQIPDFENALDKPKKKDPYFTVPSTETANTLNSSPKNNEEVLQNKRRMVSSTSKRMNGGKSEEIPSSYETALKRIAEKEKVSGVTPPKIIEGKKEHKIKETFSDTRFTEKFGITQEDIASIEGFSILSKAQQKLVFENLTQVTLGSVREEASRLCQEKNSAKREKTVTLLGKQLGGAVAGFREAFTTVYQKVKTEKNVAEKMRTGGFHEHKEMLTQLVGSIVKYGPRVHETIDGELMVDLLNVHERAQKKTLRKEEWYAMNELNSVAHAFARIPAEWRGQTLGVDTHKDSKIGLFIREKILRSTDRKDSAEHATQYSDAETRFIIAKKTVEMSLRKRGKSDAEIAQILVGLDSRVHQLQIIQNNPDALKALEEVEGRNIYWETAKGMMSTTGLGYLALGFVGRSVVGAGLGIIGAPLVSAGIASMRSWDKTSAELRERDRNARMGVGDTHEGVLNIVSSSHLVERTTHLIEQIHQAEGDTRAKLLTSLKARAEYIHDKQTLHRVDYGLRSGLVTEQTRLTETLGEALALLASEDMLLSDTNIQKRSDTIDRRLHLKLENTEQKIIDTRHTMRLKDRDISVKKAALFSLAGTLFADQMLTSDTSHGDIKNTGASSTHIYTADANENFRTYTGEPFTNVQYERW